MPKFSLRHLGDGALVCATRELVARDRLTTAELLAHLAEVDARRLYAPAGYDSMSAWCAGELHMSEDEAHKRIRVARAAYLHPALFPMLADGRLNLSTALALAPFLTAETATDLLAAAAGRTRAEVERLVAARFPRPDVPDLVMALGFGMAGGPPAPGRVGCPAPERVGGVDPLSASSHQTAGSIALAETDPDDEPAPGRVADAAHQPAPGRVRTRVSALSAGRYALQCTIDQETRDLLRRAQALLGHSVAPGDMGMVLNRALALLVGRLEKRRFGTTGKPRTCSRRPGHADPRAIPAAVRRHVYERDGGRCTFVGDGGHRCESRTALEFDHVVPVARGGETTPANLRLRCRAHNQHEAERVFGREFMRERREQARRAGDLERARLEAARARIEEVVPALRALGLSLAEARHAAARCAHMPPEVTLEERVRAVLRTLGPRGVARARPGGEIGAGMPGG